MHCRILGEKKWGGGGVRTHAGFTPLELKSNALTTRPSWFRVFLISRPGVFLNWPLTKEGDFSDSPINLIYLKILSTYYVRKKISPRTTPFCVKTIISRTRSLERKPSGAPFDTRCCTVFASRKRSSCFG